PVERTRGAARRARQSRRGGARGPSTPCGPSGNADSISSRAEAGNWRAQLPTKPGMDGDHTVSDESASHTAILNRTKVSGPWVLEVGAPEGGSSLVLRVGDRIVLGGGPNADVRVDDPTVSQRHCALEVLADRVVIEDLQSRNGTYVGAVRVKRAEVVGENGELVVGRSSVVVRAGGADVIPEPDPIPGVVGSSLGMLRVCAEVRRHARTRAPVLLQGESGTGKDVIARALHQLSRRSGAYVALNVAALPESLADGELFGHRRGAFTGAVQGRRGAFEQADGGTLFLDEIADLPASIQVKLLRVVEDGMVRPLGAVAPVHVDVRIVSASWAELPVRVQEGRF